MAMIDLKNENWEKAIVRANRALELGPSIKATFRRGVAYLETGDLDKADSDISAALKETPDDVAIK